MKNYNLFRKCKAISIVILITGITFTSKIGIIEFSKGHNNTKYESPDALGQATINVHVEIKDIFGNILGPLDNGRVVARAISPKRIRTLFCRAEGKTDENGDCILIVPVIKNEVMTYLVYANGFQTIPKIETIFISENDYKNINLVLLSLSRRSMASATINVHVDINLKSSPVVKPLANARVAARATGPKNIQTLICKEAGYTDGNGNCTLKVPVIKNEVMTYLVYANGFQTIPKIETIFISENEDKSINLVLNAFGPRPLGKEILHVHVEKETIHGNVPVKGATVEAVAFAPKCIDILRCRGRGVTDENGDCSFIVSVIDDEDVYTTFIVGSRSCGNPGYLPAYTYLYLTPQDEKEVFIEFKRLF